MNKRICITLGTPEGISYEIVSKTIFSFKQPFILLGVYNIFLENLKKYNYKKLQYFIDNVEVVSKYKISTKPFIFIDMQREDVEYISLLKVKEFSNMIKGLVTAPIDKKCIKKSIGKIKGHTDILSELFNCDVTMSFWTPKLKVALVTTHLPLKYVSQHITKVKIERTIKHLAEFIKKFNIIHPKIAVCSLNPHMGEDGNLGDEEQSIIKDVVKKFKNCKLLSGDVAFYKTYQGIYDGVISMYHDQGLSPLKMLYFNDAVNVTLGLPFFRTAPDHGVAYDLYNKGLANTTSFYNALELLIELT